MGFLFSDPQVVNSRGDTLSAKDRSALYGEEGLNNFERLAIGGRGAQLKLTPQQRGEMLYNWLTGGGPPKPVEAGKIFKERQKAAGVEAKAAAGQGINGLFGVGKMIGELSPPAAPVPTVEPLKPMKMIKPINESPMQPGVPYSAIPVPGGK